MANLEKPKEQDVAAVINEAERNYNSMEGMLADVEKQFEDFRQECEAILNDPASENELLEKTREGLAQAEEERDRAVDEIRSAATSEMVNALDGITKDESDV